MEVIRGWRSLVPVLSLTHSVAVVFLSLEILGAIMHIELSLSVFHGSGGGDYRHHIPWIPKARNANMP